MSNDGLLWVLGHQIRCLETDDTYGMIEVISPPHMPGPPPHFHKHENEFFFIVRGTLDVMTNGVWKKCAEGTFIDLSPNTTHTFINNTDGKVIWVTGWRPKGFERFFTDFGISTAQPNAQEESVSEAIVQKVVQNVQNYGMYLSE